MFTQGSKLIILIFKSDTQHTCMHACLGMHTRLYMLLLSTTCYNSITSSSRAPGMIWNLDLHNDWKGILLLSETDCVWLAGWQAEKLILMFIYLHTVPIWPALWSSRRMLIACPTTLNWIFLNFYCVFMSLLQQKKKQAHAAIWRQILWWWKGAVDPKESKQYRGVFD